MENKFECTARSVSRKLREVHIDNRIIAYNRHGNSLYIQLEDSRDPYHAIRFSDHRGRLVSRYSLRSDLKQSEVIEYGGWTYFMYAENDLRGLIMRVMKECAASV